MNCIHGVSLRKHCQKCVEWEEEERRKEENRKKYEWKVVDSVVETR